MPKTRWLWRIIKALLWMVVIYAFVYPFLQPLDPLDPEVIAEQPGTSIPEFAGISNVIEKKRAFFAYIRPAIEAQNQRQLRIRHLLLNIQEKLARDQGVTAMQRKKVANLVSEYQVSAESFEQQIEALLMRVDIIPYELVLVQAANESAWGTSRFARQGYNFFGLWCFKPGCGFVPTRRDTGASHEVAKFNNLPHAVYTYVVNLNRHPAYQQLRHIRSALRTTQQPISAEKLANGLMSYSERGQDYILELQDMIRINRKYM